MWRKSLGGRAHPLAPALSAALAQLTQLQALAVDGKFNHLTVVSQLTRLTQLKSAAPLSQAGWQVRVESILALFLYDEAEFFLQGVFRQRGSTR
jgi:hypothetical protein